MADFDVTRFDDAVRNVLTAKDRAITIGGGITTNSFLAVGANFSAVGSITSLGSPLAISLGGTGKSGTSAATASGTNAGDYTTTSTSLVAVDATNLKITMTVPTGRVAIAQACFTVTQSAGSTKTSVGIAIDGSVLFLTDQVGTSDNSCFTQTWFTGDGSSHVFELQWQVAASTATMRNANSNAPVMVVFLV